MIRFVFKYSKVSSILIFLLNIFRGLIIPLDIILIQNIISSVTEFEEVGAGSCIRYMGVFLGVQILGKILTQGEKIVRINLNNTLEINFGKEILNKCANIEYSYFEEKETYGVIDRLVNKGGNGIALIIDIVSSTLRIGVSLFGLMIYIYRVDPKILIMVILTAIPIWYFSVTAVLKEQNVFRNYYHKYFKAKYLSNIINSRENIKEARIYNFFDYINSLWKQNLKEFQDGQVKANLKPRYIAGGFVILQFFVITMILYLTLGSFDNGKIEIGVIVALAEAMRNFTGNFQYQIVTVVRQANTYKMLIKDYNKLNEFRCQNNYLENNQNRKFKKIEFKDVWFRYDENSDYVVKGITATIYSDKIIALVGHNGSGKSTMIKLLLGLLKPTKGQVLVDGIPIYDLNPKSRKKIFSVIFQDFARYNISLRENITIGNDEKDISDEDIENIIKSINDESKIMKNLKDGPETILGKEVDGGVDLSGGEWQTVAIGRAVNSNASCIIMDEPTAALDPITEAKIYKRLRNITEGKTAIFVTHRLGSTKTADLIYTLDKGELVEVGTHDELISKEGIYAEMFNIQKKWYE